MKKLVICPHCKGDVCLEIEALVSIATTDGVDNTHETAWRATLSASQVALIEHAKANGTVAAFGACVSHVQAPSQPWRLERMYLEFTKKATEKPILPDVVDKLRRAHGQGVITALQWQQVVAIVRAGVVVQFVPTGMVLGRIGNGVPGREKKWPDEVGLSEWLRTKNGYVPVAGRMFADELRKKSIGEFANIR